MQGLVFYTSLGRCCQNFTWDSHHADSWS